MPTKSIRGAQKAIAKAEQRFATAVKKDLPVGSRIVYRHGQNNIHATVSDHSYGCDQVKVEGRTGKQYWVHVAMIESLG